MIRRLGSQCLRFVTRLVTKFFEDDGSRIAGEASFFLMFSLFPLLYMAVLILGLIGDPSFLQQPQETMTTTFHSLIPDRTYQLMVDQLSRMVEHYQPTHIIFTVLLFVWPASTVFHIYLSASCRAYDDPEGESYLRLRVTAIILLVVSGSLLLVSSLMIGLAPLILEWIQERLIGIPRMMLGFRYLAAFLLITPSIGLIYRYGPSVERRARLVVWPGALVATGTWILFTQFYGLYLRRLDYIDALYGAMGGAMLLMLWMYLTSVSVILGAEVNAIIMEDSGDGS